MKKFALADHHGLVELHNTEDGANKRAMGLLNSLKSNPLFQKGLELKREDNQIGLANSEGFVAFCTIVEVDLTADEWIDKKQEIDKSNEGIFERQDRILEELTSLYNALKKDMGED